MISEATLRKFLAELFPIKATRFSLELTPDAATAVSFPEDRVVAVVQLVVRDHDGIIHDIKEQEVVLLLPHHRTERGLALLRLCAEAAAALDAKVEVELSMPHGFFVMALLDHDLDAGAMRRVLADPRALRILDARPDDAQLTATLDPDRRPRPPSRVSPELEARILERPTDAATYAVYGDWLSERGDPRGELIAVQLKLEEHPDDATLREREMRLLSENAYEWLGSLAWSPPDELGTTWRRGFLHSVRFGTPRDSGLEPSMIDTIYELGQLVTLPALTFLERLEVAPKGYASGDDVVRGIAQNGVPEHLRVLAISTGDYDELDDLEPMYPKLGALRELFIESRSMSFGRIDLPALRSLEVVTRGLTKENLASMQTARWPALERLSLSITEPDVDGCDVHLADLGWIFDGENLSHVVHLGLVGADLAPLAKALLGSKILPRLRTLDLACGSIDAEGVRVLRENAGAFAHLESLHVPRGFRGDLGGELEGLGGPIVIDDRYVPLTE